MASIETREVNTSFVGLATQLGFSWGITVVCVCSFEVLRRSKRLQHLYTPRCRLAKNPTPPIPPGLFRWIPATLKLSEEFMLSHTGLDTVMYLRFLKTSFRLMMISTLIIASTLMPLNRSSSSTALSTNTTQPVATKHNVELEIFSMSQIPSNSPVLYVHMILTYVLTALTIWLFYRDMQAYEHLSREFNLSRVKDGMLCARTVMVTELPKHLRSDESLRHYFTSLGIGQVEKAMVLRSSGKLHRRLARREHHLQELERLHVELAGNILSAVEARRSERRTSAENNLHHNQEMTTINEPNEHHDIVLVRTEESIGDTTSSSPLRIGEAARPAIATEEGHTMMSTISRALGLLSPGPSSAVMQRASTNILNAATTGNQSRNILSLEPNVSMDHDANFNIWHTLMQLPRRALDPFQPMRLSVRSHPTRQQPAIDYHLRKFNKQDRRVAELRASYTQDAKPTATGFVTFVHPASAQLCAQSLISVDSGRCRIRMAPTPSDIIWQNHKVNLASRRARRTTVNIAVSVLTVFWFFFLSGVLVLADADKIFGIKSSDENVPNSTRLISALVKNTLPTAIIALLMSILPYILLSISERTESLPTYSTVEAVTIRRYFLFFIFNVFIVFLLGRSFLESFVNIIAGVATIYDTLGVAIPRGATFFINYIVFSTCIHSLELVQLFVPIVYGVFVTSGLIRNTPRSFQHRTSPLNFPYFYYFPLHILMLVISLIYAVINPLILIFGAIYFATAYLIFKHQFAYAYVRRYETGGRYWRKAFSYTITSLLLVQITMIGVLSLKSMTIASLALAPLILLTIIFLWWCRKTFYHRIKFIPLEALRDTGVMVVDRTHEHVGDTSVALDGRPVITDAKRRGGVDVVSFVQGSPGSPGAEAPTPAPPLDTVRNQAMMRFHNNIDHYGGPGLYSAGPPSNATRSSHEHIDTGDDDKNSSDKQEEQQTGEDKMLPVNQDDIEDAELSSLNSADLQPSPHVVNKPYFFPPTRPEDNVSTRKDTESPPSDSNGGATSSASPYLIRDRGVGSTVSADMAYPSSHVTGMQRTDTANTASSVSTSIAGGSSIAPPSNPRRFHWPSRPFLNKSKNAQHHYNNDGLPPYRRLNRTSSQQSRANLPIIASASTSAAATAATAAATAAAVTGKRNIFQRVSLDLHRPLTVQIPSPTTERPHQPETSPYFNSEQGGYSLASNQAHNGGASTLPDHSISSNSPAMDVRADLVRGHATHTSYPNPYTPQRRSAPTRRYPQDLTYDVDDDVYIDPDVIRPLSWHLWLPNNPVRRLFDLDATTEIDTSLISSRSRHDGRIGAFDRNGYFIPSQYQWLGGFPSNMVVDHDSHHFTTSIGLTSMGMTSMGVNSCASSNNSADEDDEHESTGQPPVVR